ncbi:uncharacterized protein F5891DRAFT_66381 [Suillus fuscotomentosus]|uniref:Uncharacterized protein n=1 Tax=Suillus fuscotomentosus TaxID=1912939 RepID=A0AAD4EDF7_9AGAM|nr:uncharacterized protein F5891DRAFT_66381 [Suillus fuscotomentosus]KAG1904100.1 hypothetical protein F5891DRAFT_66381 [Suillus fuscotomentosus]
MGSERLSETHADMEVLVRRGMTKGYEVFSLLTPPAYAAFVLMRKGKGHFTVNRFLRATWVGGAVGCAGGGALEYIRSSRASEATVRNRRLQHAYDTASLRADDHSTIGAILFAVLTPAIFWKRASTVNLVIGGAGIGSAIGLLTHYGRTVTGDITPDTQIPDIPATSS